MMFVAFKMYEAYTEDLDATRDLAKEAEANRTTEVAAKAEIL